MHARLYQLDLMRFLAALSLVLYHHVFIAGSYIKLPGTEYTALFPIAKYLSYGVQFFFMISGYVISLSMENRTPGQFLASRALRLYPVYWFAVSVTHITMLMFHPPGWILDTPDFLFNYTMLQSFFGIGDVDGVYWTLAIELNCYLLVFLFMLVTKGRHYRLFLVLWTLSCVAAPHILPVRFHLLMFEWSLYFVAGAFFYLIHKKQHKGVWTEYLMLALIYAQMLTILPKYIAIFNGIYQQDTGLLQAALIILAFFMLFFVLTKGWLDKLNYRWFGYLGALTYPLYLLHQNIGYAIIQRLFPAETSYLILLLFLGGLLAAAYAVHKWIEVPIQQRLKPWLMQAWGKGNSKPSNK